MNNQEPQEPAVMVEIAAEATLQPGSLMGRMKAAMTDISARQILKLALLGLALIAWFPIYHRLDAFSKWISL